MPNIYDLLLVLGTSASIAAIVCAPTTGIAMLVVHALCPSIKITGKVFWLILAASVSWLTWDAIPNYLALRSAAALDGGLRITRTVAPDGLQVDAKYPGQELFVLDSVVSGDIPFMEYALKAPQQSEPLAFIQIKVVPRGIGRCLSLPSYQECEWRERGMLPAENCVSKTETSASTARYTERESVRYADCQKAGDQCLRKRQRVLWDMRTGEQPAKMTEYSISTKLSRALDMGKGCMFCFSYPATTIYQDWRVAERAFGVIEKRWPPPEHRAACVKGQSPYADHMVREHEIMRP